LDGLAAPLARADRLLKQRSYEDAVQVLTRVLEAEPGHPDALHNLAGIYALLRQPAQAKVYLDRLLLMMPQSSQVNLNAAMNALAMNQVELAIELSRRAVSLTPKNADAHLTLADALEAGGQFQEAKAHYLAVLDHEPRHVMALSKLLALRDRQIPERYELEARQLLSSNALPDTQQTLLNFGLAQYYDGRQRYDEAFTHISAVNAARHRWFPFDSDRFSRIVDELIRVFSKQALGSLPIPGVGSDRAIFIVGMPRSGTTLVEQIIASHSRIAAGGELPTMTNIATDIARTPARYPAGVISLDASTLTHHAARYLTELTGISADALRVTDKMPFNFVHLGLVAALCPRCQDSSLPPRPTRHVHVVPLHHFQQAPAVCERPSCTGTLLPRLSPLDGPLEGSAHGSDPGRELRTPGDRHRTDGEAPGRILRCRLGARLCGVLPDGAWHQHAEPVAGTATDLSACRRSLAQL